MSTVNACYINPPHTIPPTYNLSTVTPQQVVAASSLLPEEGTIVVLILLTVIAVLTIVALILCYVRKRPLTHIPNQGICGRFASDAGGLQKSPETEALKQKGDRDANRGDVWQTVQSSLGVNIFCK